MSLKEKDIEQKNVVRMGNYAGSNTWREPLCTSLESHLVLLLQQGLETCLYLCIMEALGVLGGCCIKVALLMRWSLFKSSIPLSVK